MKGGAMELSQAVQETLNEMKSGLSGYKRRHFMAQVVESMFDGKPSRAEKVLGWNRITIRKALAEWNGGFCYIDQYHLRGRKKAEEHLPNLLSDIKAIVDSQSQTDPTFQTNRLYTRLSATEVRKQLIAQKGYTDTAATISAKLNAMGYHLRAVQKSRPKKKRLTPMPSL
jgi:hypothetical protein